MLKRNLSDMSGFSARYIGTPPLGIHLSLLPALLLSSLSSLPESNVRPSPVAAPVVTPVGNSI